MSEDRTDNEANETNGVNENMNDSENINDNGDINDSENINDSETINDSENNNSSENEDTNETVNENLTVNQLNDESKEKQSENVSLNRSDNSFTELNNEKEKKYKGGMRKRIVSYIIVGVICSTLGGVGSAIVTFNMMKNSSDTNVSSAPKVSTTDLATNAKAKLITTNSTTVLTVPEIVKKVSPSVVAISTTSAAVSSDFSRQAVPQEGVGTGMIFSKDGYILTNYHVVSGAQSIKVMMSDGKEVSAKVINFDAEADVAVIKLADNTKVPGIAEFGDSDALQVGESVVAIGNPLGKELIGSVTTGIVSAVNRQVSIENTALKFIQTDAAINPGNSGGPLVNSKGQVIGINTAKISVEGVEGLGFSIPINMINPKIEGLLKPVLTIGISCKDITQGTGNSPVGVGVLQVQESSPAEKSGIKSGDIITQFDGKKVKTVDELNKIKGTHKAGDVVKIELDRNGKTIKINLTLSE